jgi:folate-dependent phosphoribosylglycinamide formyltransferase PurN
MADTWAVAKGQNNFFGTTIHYVDPGVDTGGIIEQVFAEPEREIIFIHTRMFNMQRCFLC